MESPPLAAHSRPDEFPPGAAEAPAGMARRDFLRIMGASLAMASAGGCFRRPSEKIHPYVSRPPELLGHDTLSFATSYNWRGYGRGLLAKSFEGRPIKLDGNPDHPSSLGATDPVMQAAVLDLYNPLRLRAPQRQGLQIAWSEYHDALRARLAQRRAQRGAGLWFVAEPNSSPTEQRLWRAIAAAYPEARFVFEVPSSQLHYPPVDYDFAAADVVLGIGPDFLTEHPESLRYARAFTARRRGWRDGGSRMNRFFSLHAVPNVTTTMADDACLLEAPQWPAVLAALEARIEGRESAPAELPEAARPFVEAAAASLLENRGRGIVLAGSTEPPEIHAWAARFNQLLGNRGDPVRPLRPAPLTAAALPAEQLGSLAELEVAIDDDAVRELLILDANPVYTAPHRRFERRIPHVPFSVFAGTMPHETAAACGWNLPLHHFLEDWGDLRAFTGEPSPVQPLIHPIHDSRSRLELLQQVANPTEQRSAHALVRASWQSRAPAADFEAWWRGALVRGILPVSGDDPPEAPDEAPAPSPEVLGAALQLPPAEAPGAESTFVLEIRLDPTLEDGRHASNAWLQELPKPLSKLVWDNGLWVHPEVAKERGWKEGDLVGVSCNGLTIGLPVWPQPGISRRTVVAFLGYGRSGAGLTAEAQSGFDVYPLWDGENRWRPGLARVRRTGARYELVSLQHHREMEGHDFVRLRQPGKEPEAHHHYEPEKSSFYPHAPDQEGAPSPYQWGMSIDLSTCIGCSACVVACFAENNIPMVGKDEVARGREMHWLRIDQYVAHGHAHDHPLILHQPRPCMHCEKAPCELVCPVAATVHDREGLNAMIYNRCIGTRYCSNNCPYKVRCFNFFDYRPPEDSLRNLQFNPDVTVRERGVMEKCTYCVQRISQGRIAAKSRNERIPPNSVKTACQEACPTDAIVFGNLTDPEWRVVEMKRGEGDYGLLAELDTRPRTTYLPKWRNPTT